MHSVCLATGAWSVSPLGCWRLSVSDNQYRKGRCWIQDEDQMSLQRGRYSRQFSQLTLCSISQPVLLGATRCGTQGSDWERFCTCWIWNHRLTTCNLIHPAMLKKVCHNSSTCLIWNPTGRLVRAWIQQLLVVRFWEKKYGNLRVFGVFLKRNQEE